MAPSVPGFGLRLGFLRVTRPVGRHVDPVTSAPTGVSATAGDASVTLAWTAPALATNCAYRQSADGGSTWGSWISMGTVSGPYTVTGLTNGTAYSFQVAGGNAAGRGPASSTVSATPVAGYDADAVAYWSRGATTPTDAQKQKLSDLVTSLKSAGVWSLLDICQLYAAPYADLAPLNLKGTSYTATPTNSPAWTAGSGYKTDAISSYVDTGLNGATTQYTQNNASWGLLCNAAPAGGSAASGMVGVGGSGPSTYMAWTSGNTIQPRCQSTTTVSYTSMPNATTRTGFYAFVRSASTGFDIYVDGSSVTTITAASVAPVAQNVLIGHHGSAYNIIGAQCFFAGAALTATQVAALNTAVTAYLS